MSYRTNFYFADAVDPKAASKQAVAADIKKAADATTAVAEQAGDGLNKAIGILAGTPAQTGADVALATLKDAADKARADREAAEADRAKVKAEEEKTAKAEADKKETERQVVA